MTSNYEFDTQIKGWLDQPFLFAFEINRVYLLPAFNLPCL